MDTPAGIKLLRLPAVCQRVGLGRSSIYARIAAGTFPAPVSLGGGRAVAWRSDEIDSWISQLPRAGEVSA